MEATKYSNITLRPFTLSDADVDGVMLWASDERVTKFARRHPYTHRDEALHFLTTHILPHPYYRAIIVDGLDDKPVGSISVAPCSGDGNGHRASIGYRIAYDHWGKGIATAALRRAVEEVMVSAGEEAWRGLVRLEAVADVENVASQRVLEKAGFAREGVLRSYVVLKGEVRDVVMFSFVRKDLGGLDTANRA